MDKLKMHTPNLTAANVERIRELFPNCVTEARDEKGALRLSVDFDLLHQELSESIVEGPQERYQLNWPGKREALITANLPIAKTLRPNIDDSENFDTTKNLFIEGDNLDALKLLQESYLGKVKMIYIDPPYNTGKDFVYKDDFSDSLDDFLKKSQQRDEVGARLVTNVVSNGRFHSNWLSMLYSRLRLARNLLREDGVIFVSIDECEVANLKIVGNEVFGEASFIIDMIWRKRDGAPNDRTIGSTHEYILAWGKSLNAQGTTTIAEERLRLMPRTEKANAEYQVFKEPDGPDSNGAFRKIDTTANAKGGRDVASLHYAVKNPFTGELVYPRAGTCWRHSQEEMERLQGQGRLYWGVNGTATTPMRKLYLSEAKDGMSTPSILPGLPLNQHAARELEVLYGEKSMFDTPKPVDLVKFLTHLGSGKDGIVLDFFAGSATTAHAVMKLNAEDGGNRKFIMVQLPEECTPDSEAAKAGYSTIAEISKERIRRAGKKILEGEVSDGWDKDIGFRVLKVDSSNMADVHYIPDETQQTALSLGVSPIKPDRTPEDLLFQVLLDWSVGLTLPISKEKVLGKWVYLVNGGEDLMACFDTQITEELIEALADRKPQPLRVVFRDDAFVSDAVKINAEQIFKQKCPGTEVKSI